MNEAARVNFKVTATKEGSLIEVRDNGRGIPRDRLPQLFTAVRSSSTGGMGIGLSLCRTIVEAHGGAIWAQNNPEGGASFFILLPSKEEEEA
jgi:signal transduction histidine kinase